MAGEHYNDDKTNPLIDLSQTPKVSQYVLVSKIGSGGMGEVYLAEDTSLNRKVALKFLSPHLCQDSDCRARFKREAQAAAKLNHPNIATIHEVSEFNGRHLVPVDPKIGIDSQIQTAYSGVRSGVINATGDCISGNGILRWKHPIVHSGRAVCCVFCHQLSTGGP